MICSSTTNGYQINIPISFYNYNLLEIIGNGSTSIVALIEDKKSHAQYSAKITSKKHAINQNILQSINDEIKILKILNHPNIIKFYESFEIKNNKNEEFIVIVTEYCSKGDLLSYTTDLGFENQTLKMKIYHGILSAIHYLHNQGIAHCDIKSENILLDSDYNAKLCDFGYSQTKIIQDDENFKRGTLYYAAPELFHPGKFNTLKADIYAIGIMLYSLDQLEFPVKDGDEMFISSQISRGKLSFKKDINRNLLSLVLRCTNMDADKRPEIEDLMNDEYFDFNNSSEKVINFDSYISLNNELKYSKKENFSFNILHKDINYSNQIKNYLISYIKQSKNEIRNIDFTIENNKNNSKNKEMILLSYVLKDNKENGERENKLKKLKNQLVLNMINERKQFLLSYNLIL